MQYHSVQILTFFPFLTLSYPYTGISFNPISGSKYEYLEEFKSGANISYFIIVIVVGALKYFYLYSATMSV